MYATLSVRYAEIDGTHRTTRLCQKTEQCPHKTLYAAAFNVKLPTSYGGIDFALFCTLAHIFFFLTRGILNEH